jgi:CubicO group peptidase (beta-lactamase class C family)
LLAGRRAPAAGRRTIGFQVATGDLHGLDPAFGGLAEAGRPVTSATLFQAASCSKTVAALTVLTLVRDGRVDLDRPVNQVLTRWRLAGRCADRATPAALLSHTAGTSVTGFPGYVAGAAIPSLRQILDGARPANTSPVRASRLLCGRYRYSGGGTTILQLLAEEVTGRSFAEVARTQVLEPLGAGRASFALEPAGDIAHGHRDDGSPLAGGYRRHPESAAAGLWATAADLARIMQGLMASVAGAPGALLPQDLALRMVTPVRGHAALGVFSDRGRAVWHDGTNAGYRALVTADFETMRVAAGVANSDAGMAILHEELTARSAPDVARAS